MRIRNVKNKEIILKENGYVIENPGDYIGKWNEVFQNDNKINLEIGTGKCSFIYEMARQNKDINFIGIERIDTVLALGIKEIEKRELLPNLRLINYDAYKVDELFKNEIDTLYLNFSDPWPKKRHEKRRLSSKLFLEKYDDLFKDENKIEMKTDNDDLFEYSTESFLDYGYKIIKCNTNYFDKFTTEYEDKFIAKGKNINYIFVVKE